MGPGEHADDPARLTGARRLRFLARDSFVYGVATALQGAFSLITFPLLARYFSVADYGLIDLFTVVSALLTIALVFGQDSAVARFLYEHADPERRRQVVSQSLALQLGIACATLPVLWLASGYLAGIVSETPKSALLLELVILTLPFNLMVNFSQNLLKWTFSRARFLLVSMGSVFARVLLLLAAVGWFEIGVEGVFVITLGVQAIAGVVGMIFVRRWIARPAHWTHLRELLAFAVPLGVICSVGALTPVLERSIVSRLIGPEELGLYAAGAKAAMLVGVLNLAFYTAWGPFALAIHKASDVGDTYKWVLRAYTLAICTLVLVLTALADSFIRLLASERYAGAAVVVFPLSMALAVQGIGWVSEIGITLSKKTCLGLYAHPCFSRSPRRRSMRWARRRVSSARRGA